MNKAKWKWMSKSNYEKISNGIKIYAPANTDYFVNPMNNEICCNAPFLYQEVTGDFVYRVKVYLDFENIYDACVLLAYDNERLWAKACLEYSDYKMHTIVSVMTNQVSDDANHQNIDNNEVYLQLSRKGNMFGVHYSKDGENYTMARLTYLAMSDTIKVGLEAQSPMGNGGMRYFTDISLELISLDDIRDGNH